MKKILLMILVLGLLFSTAACQSHGGDVKSSASKNAPFMKHFNLENIETNQEETADIFSNYEKNLVLFWKGNNPSSLHNIKILEVFQKKYPNVQVLLVAVETEKEQAKEVLNHEGFKLPCLLGTKDYYEQLKYAIADIPTLFILNDEGKSLQAPISGKFESVEQLEKLLHQK